MRTQLASTSESANPLDSIEEILLSHNWVYNRMNDDELTVQVTGNAGEYRLFFLWQEDMGALHFTCRYDLRYQSKDYDAAARALMQVNQKAWIGHFDLPRETGTPFFRHTSLLRAGSSASTAEAIEDIVRVAMNECERFYPVFHMLCHNEVADSGALSLAMMDTRGSS
ncbi:MAG: YbjN domain-containing protein [Alphaproteobacteria bacterium]|nr:YbjN domain-containing protein [Alphaproteobacteria bacterium]